MGGIVLEKLLFCIAKILLSETRGSCGRVRIAGLLVHWLAAVAPLAAGQAWAQPAPPGSAPAVTVPAASAAASGPAEPARPQWLRAQRLHGRITAATLGLVINEADPYSVAVGAYYAQVRQIPEENIVRLRLPDKATLTRAEFEHLREQLDKRLPAAVQGLALAWVKPYAVECNGLTGALALGFQPELCANSCGASKLSAYVQYGADQPYAELGLRPAMQIAARTVDSAKALIDRGVRADHSLPSAYVPANAYFLSTSDAARNVRAIWFPPAAHMGPLNVDTKRIEADALPQLPAALIVETGLARVPGLDHVDWLPGALADHLTSYGGLLDGPAGTGQMTAIDWIEAGATASYGTVSEPCNHWQKFPHPQLLLLSYVQGVSALEAYWHSVVWPGQGAFVGDPLAAPFAPLF